MNALKFYLVIFFYIFLFGALGSVYSEITEEIVVPDDNSNPVEISRVQESGSVIEDVVDKLVPKVAATEPVREFVLIIPKIDLEKEVVENVNPADPDEYLPVLNENIAHGKYTRMPDGAVDEGNVYLFAHREWEFEGQNAGFFSKIGELGAGDIAIIKYNGKNYSYIFQSKKLVDVKNVSIYTSESVSPTLTLQTCEGSEKRLIVSFTLVGIE